MTPQEIEALRDALISFLIKRNQNFDITLFVNAHELAEDFCREFEANCIDQQVWIDVTERQPEVFQEVAFIVKSRDKIYNGRRMGGMYQGFIYRYHGFTTPGVEFEGTHWMPLPEIPKTN